MATRSLWRTRGKLAVAATVASSEDPETALKLCTAVPVRLYLDTVTAQTPSIALICTLFMTDTATADRPTVELIVNTLHRVFPSFLLTDGLVDEISESLPKVGMVGCPSCSSNYCISLMGKT